MQTLKPVDSRHAMPTSFNCQRSYVPLTVADWNISAPGGAQQGLEPMLRTTKNPASSAGHVRPSAMGCVLLAQPPRRICSKLVLQQPGVCNQPHLELSRQARSVRGLPDESGLHQHQESIAVSCMSSSIHNKYFCVNPVNFSPRCGYRVTLLLYRRQGLGKAIEKLHAVII